VLVGNVRSFKQMAADHAVASAMVTVRVAVSFTCSCHRFCEGCVIINLISSLMTFVSADAENSSDSIASVSLGSKVDNLCEWRAHSC
jgi:hypothetical protein